MKIHPLLIEQIVIALERIFVHSAHADKVIEFVLKSHKKWGARDRRFFAESVYEIVRNRRRYWNLAGFPDADYLEPEFIRDETLRDIWLAYWLYKGGELPMDFRNSPRIQERVKNAKKILSAPEILHSVPDELMAWGKENWGSEWEKILESLNQPAEVFLRTNTLKIKRSELQSLLSEEGIETFPLKEIPTALQLKERKNVFITKAFKQGLFEVQDAGSQMIAPFLQVKAGDRVVDACAGAGGKTLHLASIMQNKGKIIAMDIYPEKLKELKLRARRNGVDLVETRHIESNKVIKRMAGSAQRLLLDVPCTGIGVLKRNPDTKWKWSLQNRAELIELQKNILESYTSMVARGGSCVYATCSIDPAENEKQIQYFLNKHELEWELEEELFLRPDLQGYDGFYAARLKKL